MPSLQEKYRQHGFTLIEMMIVVAIIAILMAIALPAYSKYVVRSRRAAAAGCLQEQAQFAERFYTTNMTYIGVDGAMPAPECKSDLQPYYNFQTSGVAAGTFTLTAQAIGIQAARDIECLDLSINQTGAKSVTGSNSGNPSLCF